MFRTISQPPGVLAPNTPRQTMPSAAPASFNHGRYTITPLADFEVTARLLSRERYRWDSGSDLSPIDFALGWGAMSDSAILDQLDISQSNRWFSWQTKTLPIPLGDIINQSTNCHIIPADDLVRSELLSFRPGQIITLEGKLVSISALDGYRWISSVSRTDTGDGSCEVMWVERAFVSP